MNTQIKKYTILLLLFISLFLNAQNEYITNFITSHHSNQKKAPSALKNDTIYKSSDGFLCPPKGVFRSLVIFINIIYDQTPTDTVLKYSAQGDTYWKHDIVSSTNNFLPTYFSKIFETDVDTVYYGCTSRFYAESSFYTLHLLADYTVINIRQSEITKLHPGENFTHYQLMDAVARFINRNGGLQTVYGHNNGSDYDRISFDRFNQKPDGKIDMIHFITRNTFYTNFGINYGSVRPNQGYAGEGIYPFEKLKIGDFYYGYNIGTYQCVGTGDMGLSTRSILNHEIAHFFIGGNEFHTSGANHPGDFTFLTNTFIGTQKGGFGLFDGGLSSCNGYERWRLGWNSNPEFPISADNQNSDIDTIFVGERTFKLRDFVTTGDVIRIKLPYKDNSESSNQYIWLENHQSGKNNKIDEMNYNFPGTCRDVNKPGIYAYYQVGKDILESTNYDLVFPINEKDNLRMISAEGNWDVNYVGNYDDCLHWAGSAGRARFEYIRPNAFMGKNDQTEVFKTDFSLDSLQYGLMQYMGAKIKNGVLYNNLPWVGDDLDAFVPTSEGISLNMSTNPATVNTTTYYSIQNVRVQNKVTYIPVDSVRNTSSVYLTGLNITMIDPDTLNTGMKEYLVKIRWDDYDINQDVYWTGNIVLNERLNLMTDNNVYLWQSKSVNQIPKDSVSGIFAKTTIFTCNNNSHFIMQPSSNMFIAEKSSFVMNSGSNLNINNKATITVEEGSTLFVKANANLSISGEGKIIIKSGAFICIEPGVNLNLSDPDNQIKLETGAIIGKNPKLFEAGICSELK